MDHLAFVYVKCNKFWQIVLKSFIPNLPEPCGRYMGLDTYDFDLIKFLLENFPPIRFEFINGVYFDNQLEQSINGYFPLSIHEYYKNIIIYYESKLSESYCHTNGLLRIASSDLIKPWVRNATIPVQLCFIADEYVGDFYYIQCVRPNCFRFGNIQKLFITNGIKCDYESAEILFLNSNQTKIKCDLLFANEPIFCENVIADTVCISGNANAFKSTARYWIIDNPIRLRKNLIDKILALNPSAFILSGDVSIEKYHKMNANEIYDEIYKITS